MQYNINPVEKNSLFFNRYEFSVRFDLEEVTLLRGLPYDRIEEMAEDRNRWRRESGRNFGWRHDRITQDQVIDLKTLCSVLLGYRDEIKFTVSYNRGYVYTNNLAIIDRLQGLEFLTKIHVQQVQTVGRPNTISLKNPSWSHRTYFRSKVISNQQREMLIEYLNGRQNIRLSSGLKNWMINRKSWETWVQDYFFFDHNNDGELLFLNMVIPRITGRTLQIVAK